MNGCYSVDSQEEAKFINPSSSQLQPGTCISELSEKLWRIRTTKTQELEDLQAPS